MRNLWLGIIGLAVATTANAAVVTYTLSLNDNGTGTFTANNWAVYIQTSAGDNAGLFGFGVDLNGTFSTVLNRANGLVMEDSTNPGVDPKSLGFTTGRTADVANGKFSGLQDLSAGSNLIPIYGIGQIADRLTNHAPSNYDTITSTFGAGANPYNAKFLAGRGVWSGSTLPSFDQLSVDSKASVYVSNNGTANVIAPITYVTVGGLSNTLTVANTAVGTQLATDGKIVVTGSNNQYSSEVDQLTADANNGTASVQTIGDEAGTLYVMAQITGTPSDVSAVLSGPLNNASGSSQAPLLHAAYDSQFGPGGFNLLFSMPNFAGAKNINWNFAANPGAVVNELAIVPEPATIGLIGFAALGLLARRRRNA